MVNKDVQITQEDESMPLSLHQFNNMYGYINYGYNKDAGLFVFMGSYIYTQFRGQGRFKEMIKTLLSEFPEGTIIQAPVQNKKLIQLFKRMNFQKVDRLEYWGKLGNAVLLQGVLSNETLKLI